MAEELMDRATAERLAWESLLRVVICPRCETTATQRNKAGQVVCAHCRRAIVDGVLD